MTGTDAVDDVLAAWLDAGPAPSYHRAAQAKLRREWPTLARAIERLAADSATAGSRRQQAEYDRRLGRLIDSAIDATRTNKHGNVIDYGPQFGESDA